MALLAAQLAQSVAEGALGPLEAFETLSQAVRASGEPGSDDYVLTLQLTALLLTGASPVEEAWGVLSRAVLRRRPPLRVRALTLKDLAAP